MSSQEEKEKTIEELIEEVKGTELARLLEDPKRAMLALFSAVKGTALEYMKSEENFDSPEVRAELGGLAFMAAMAFTLHSRGDDFASMLRGVLKAAKSDAGQKSLAAVKVLSDTQLH